jgi:hypothetical protein
MFSEYVSFDMQYFRMKSIKNKLYLGNQFSYTYPVYVIVKENSDISAYAHAAAGDLR